MWRAIHAPPGAPFRILDRREDLEMALASGQGLLWLDIQDPAVDEIPLLSEVFKLDPLAVEDVVAETHQPKVDDYGHYLYLAVHGIRVGGERGDLATHELDVVLSDRWLITHRGSDMRSVAKSWDRAVKSGALPGGTTAAALQAILATQAANHVDEVERLQAELCDVEPLLLENSASSPPHLRRLFEIKSDLARLRRVLGDQREVVHRLSRGEFEVIPKKLHMHFRDVYDDLYRAAEMTDLIRDIANSTLETHLSLAAHRTNEIMKVLTIISCLILPMTLVTGWYGMNFRNLSGLDWKYSELAVLGMFAGLIAGFGFFLRRQKWI